MSTINFPELTITNDTGFTFCWPHTGRRLKNEELQSVALSTLYATAADSLERNWDQQIGGNGWKTGTKNCAQVALTRELNLRIPIISTYTYDQLKELICPPLLNAIGGSSMDDIYVWNDAPQRTQAEVVAMFRAIAASEQAREAAGLAPQKIKATHPTEMKAFPVKTPEFILEEELFFKELSFQKLISISDEL